MKAASIALAVCLLITAVGCQNCTSRMPGLACHHGGCTGSEDYASQEPVTFFMADGGRRSNDQQSCNCGDPSCQFGRSMAGGASGHGASGHFRQQFGRCSRCGSTTGVDGCAACGLGSRIAQRRASGQRGFGCGGNGTCNGSCGGRGRCGGRIVRVYNAMASHTGSTCANGLCGRPPGPSSGSVMYPYYTTRGPRDFLMSNPPSIGP